MCTYVGKLLHLQVQSYGFEHHALQVYVHCVHVTAIEVAPQLNLGLPGSALW